VRCLWKNESDRCESGLKKDQHPHVLTDKESKARQGNRATKSRKGSVIFRISDYRTDLEYHLKIPSHVSPTESICRSLWRSGLSCVNAKSVVTGMERTSPLCLNPLNRTVVIITSSKIMVITLEDSAIGGPGARIGGLTTYLLQL